MSVFGWVAPLKELQPAILHQTPNEAIWGLFAQVSAHVCVCVCVYCMCVCARV